MIHSKFPTLAILLLALSVSCSRETGASAVAPFYVVVYNVENLFDIDGVALFDDYSQEGDVTESYSARKLLTKLESIAAVLGTLNEGKGPDIILFQELEADFTPSSSIDDYAMFLKAHEGTTVAEMLDSDWTSDYAGYSAAAWLVKTLSDAGMTGYELVTVPSMGLDSGIAHTNAVFSRYPIKKTTIHPLVEARSIQEVVLDVDGSELIVLNNHWKSGASNPAREPIRVENARVLKARIDALLEENPFADIIVGGDLNSHYNHSVLYPSIETGVNDILGSQGDELALQKGEDVSLYNLWYELAPEERYSEVWRGRRGTLMHMLLTKGLYDNGGIRYVDGSFQKLVVPGLNVDGIGRPLKWSSLGVTGNGASDHLPIYSVFERVTGVPGEFAMLREPSTGEAYLDFEMPHGYPDTAVTALKDGAFLSALKPDALGEFVGTVYTVDAILIDKRPLKLKVADQTWPAYVPDSDLFAEIRKIPEESNLSLVVTLGVWYGKPQLLVEKLL